jgi:glycosyltransferase involved in cell wall biosynthesis
MVIVDDGSTDKTLELIIDYTKNHTKDKNIVVRGF